MGDSVRWLRPRTAEGRSVHTDNPIYYQQLNRMSSPHPAEPIINTQDVKKSWKAYVLAQERWPLRCVILLAASLVVVGTVVEASVLVDKERSHAAPVDPGHLRRSEGVPPKSEAHSQKNAAAAQERKQQPVADQPNPSDMIVVQKQQQHPLKKPSPAEQPGEQKRSPQEAVDTSDNLIVPEGGGEKVVDPTALPQEGACACLGRASHYGDCKRWFPYDKSPWCTVAKPCTGAKKSAKLGLWALCDSRSPADEKTPPQEEKKEKNVHEIVDEPQEFVDPDSSIDAAMVDDILDEQTPKNENPSVRRGATSSTTRLLDKILHEDFKDAPRQKAAPLVQPLALQSAQAVKHFEAARDSLQDSHGLISDKMSFLFPQRTSD